MSGQSRRGFLADVGRGMLLASVGPALATDMGLGRFSRALADDDSDRLSFGELEPLVALMQETPADRLQPVLVERLRAGTSLKTLIAAGGLANARTFGGNDYIGFHTLMALSPAFEMAAELPSEQRPLPVLKVLYRNADRIQAEGGREREKLRAVSPASPPEQAAAADWLLAETRSADYARAEQAFAAFAQAGPGEMWNLVLPTVYDNPDVHRVVLAWRAWSMLDFTGHEHAHTLLRQSVRYAVRDAQNRRNHKYPTPEIQSVLPRLMDQFHLTDRSPGTRPASDAWIDELARTVFASDRAQAAEAAAQALADGYSADAVGEALSIAANMLLLYDDGRKKEYDPAKPVGSVHGDSVGVHASDAANAWRHIARVSNPRNAIASLIVGAYHTAGQRGQVDEAPWPLAGHREAITTDDPARLLEIAESAIRNKDQGTACAAVARYETTGRDARPVFDLLLKYATSEDGALHAEKYYRTVSENFSTIRPAFRWRQLVALARVTASEFGRPAPGQAQARELLGLS